MRGFRGFQNISKFRGIYGNLVEISADVLLFAPDFQKSSTFGLLIGNLLEISADVPLFALDFQKLSTFGLLIGNLVEISADVLLFALDFQKRSTFGLLFGNLVEIMPRGSAFQADTHLYTHRKALLGEHTANKWPVKCFSRSYSPNPSPMFCFR